MRSLGGLAPPIVAMLTSPALARRCLRASVSPLCTVNLPGADEFIRAAAAGDKPAPRRTDGEGGPCTKDEAVLVSIEFSPVCACLGGTMREPNS